jgi:hypothetical protein
MTTLHLPLDHRFGASLRVLGVAALACAVAACGDDGAGTGGAGSSSDTSSSASGSGGDGPGSGGGDAGSGGETGAGGDASSSSGGAEVCEATFRVLQKDAYKETAGRSSDLWPPHTTTVLEVTCDGDAVDDAFEANHGTEPGQTDANGDVILVEVASYAVEGSRAELSDLLAAYADCDCEAETEFLSLDSLQGDLAEGLMETVLGYVQTNLTCPGDDLDALLGALQAGDFETAVTIFPTCEWVGGASFEQGLSEAFTEVVAATGALLDDYHVCNNDAAVQMALFDGFAADGTLTCPGGDLCHGPLWFYVAE